MYDIFKIIIRSSKIYVCPLSVSLFLCLSLYCLSYIWSLPVYRNLAVYNCLMTHLSVYFFEYVFVYVYVCLKHLAYHVTADISPLELPTDNDTKSWNNIDSVNSADPDQTGPKEKSDLGLHCLLLTHITTMLKSTYSNFSHICRIWFGIWFFGAQYFR